MNTRWKFFTTALLTVLVIATSSNFFAVSARGNALTDNNDSFYVITPAGIAFQRGEVHISWVAFDDDRTIVPYEINLRKGNRCETLVGLIAAGNAPSVNTTQNVTWQSAQPLASTVNVADGRYCLEVCVSLRDGGDNYAACNSRWIDLRNQNTAPTFTTNPPQDRALYPDEGWSYLAKATDKEGDKLSFALLQKPFFAKVDAQTGLVTTDAAAKTAGLYTFVLEVKDALGATSTQTWQLQIASRDQTSTSSVQGTATSANLDQPIPTDKLKIDTPTTDTTFGGDSNHIGWSVSEFAGFEVDRFTLSYLADGSEKPELIAELPAATRSFIWDVRNLVNGKYTLLLQARTTENVLYEVRSGKFNITNPASGETISRPLIVNLSPADNSEVENLRPIISGEFARPQGGQIDAESFVLEVDGLNQAAWCGRVTESEFSCQPGIDLEPGLHRARVGIQSKDKQLAVREWTFVVKAPPASATSVTNILSGVNWQLVIALCLFVFVLVLLPWGVYLLWRRRQRDSSVDVVYKPETQEYDVYYQAPANENVYVIPEPTLPGLDDDFQQPPKTEPKTQPKVEFKPQPKAEVKVEAKPVKAEPPKQIFVDPTDFATYEDYLKAVNTQKPNSAKSQGEPSEIRSEPKPENKPAPKSENQSENKVEPKSEKPAESPKVVVTPSTETKPTDNVNFIAPPDYLSEMKPAVKVEEKKASEKSGSDTPDWLNPV